MTDLALTDTSVPVARKRGLVRLMLVPAAIAAGVSSTVLGVWAPLSMLDKAEAPANVVDAPSFLELPRLLISLPATPPRTLAISVVIETPAQDLAQSRLLQPRLTDAFTAFLSDIDPAAFARRGVLEVVRAELTTRAGYILGPEAVRNVLITEFRIQ